MCRSGISVVGLGNWGTSLAQGLVEAGMPLLEVVVRGARRRGVVQPVVSLADASLDAEVLWLCVPDGRIEAATREIVARRPGLAGQTVVHSSGALSVDVLEAAQKAGAAVGSVHPVMSFPTRRAVPLQGVLFGVEAQDAATRRRLEVVVKLLGGRTLAIDAKGKALYHAAGTMASPLIVSAMTAAMETARLAGLTRAQAAELVGALAAATVGNVRERGVERSFSGPFARGDAATIELHLRALAAHPILADVYRALAAEAVEKLPVRRRDALRRVLKAGSGKARKK